MSISKFCDLNGYRSFKGFSSHLVFRLVKLLFFAFCLFVFLSRFLVFYFQLHNFCIYWFNSFFLNFKTSVPGDDDNPCLTELQEQEVSVSFNKCNIKWKRFITQKNDWLLKKLITLHCGWDSCIFLIRSRGQSSNQYPKLKFCSFSVHITMALL